MKRPPAKVTVGMLAVAGLAVATVGLPSASASSNEWRMPSVARYLDFTVTPDQPGHTSVSRP